MTDMAEAEIAPAEHVEEQYVVRLLFKFNAASPAEAVERMISELADNGLRQWHYRVEDTEGNLFFVTGHGETRTIEELVGRGNDDDEDDEEGDDDEPGADQP